MQKMSFYADHETFMHSFETSATDQQTLKNTCNKDNGLQSEKKDIVNRVGTLLSGCSLTDAFLFVHF